MTDMTESRGSTGGARRSVRGRALLATAVAAMAVMAAACVPTTPAPTTTTTTEATTTTTEAPTTTTTEAPPTFVPEIQVTNTTGLPATGGTVTVTGTGFDPSLVNPAGPIAGIYVALGRGASTTYPEVFTSAKFIRPTGPAVETATGSKLNTDGTFSATITLASLFSASNTAVNCYIEQCSLYVFSAHTGSYAPWTFTKTAVTFQAPTAPTVVLSKSTGLAAAGQAVTVTGAGFAATSPGIYVAYGPIDPLASWWLDASTFGAALWTHTAGPVPQTTGQAKLNADGTFSVTMTPVAAYGSVDCNVTACSFVTMKAHGSTDRTQDTVKPITFAAPAA